MGYYHYLFVDSLLLTLYHLYLITIITDFTSMTSKTHLVLSTASGSYSRVVILCTSSWTTWLALVPKWLAAGVGNIDVVLPSLEHHNTFGLTRVSSISWHRSSFMTSCAVLNSLMCTITDWSDVLVAIESTIDLYPVILPWLPWDNLLHIVVVMPGSCHLRRLSRYTNLNWSKIEHPHVGGCTTLSAWIGIDHRRVHYRTADPDYCYTSIRDILGFTPASLIGSPVSPPPDSMPHRATGVLPLPGHSSGIYCHGLVPSAMLIHSDLPPMIVCPTYFTSTRWTLRDLTVKELTRCYDLPVSWEKRIDRRHGDDYAATDYIRYGIPVKVLVHALVLAGYCTQSGGG